VNLQFVAPRRSPRARAVSWILGWIVLATAGLVGAEVVYLNNGDVVTGEIVSANNRSVTLKTAYGQLVIPKDVVTRIEYEGGASVQPNADEEPEAKTPDRRAATGAAKVSLNIRGRSFWYAFNSPQGSRTDIRIRMKLYLGNEPVCTLMDSKPDTVDGNTLYNSFTFSPTDSQVVDVASGYACRVEEARDGLVVLRLDLPKSFAAGRANAQMRYEINSGDTSLAQWGEAVTVGFSIPIESGKETSVVIEQNSDALEYSGFLKKQMKNVRLFQVSVLSSSVQSDD